jgi:hypothetical protein
MAECDLVVTQTGNNNSKESTETSYERNAAKAKVSIMINHIAVFHVTLGLPDDPHTPHRVRHRHHYQ